MQTSLYHYTSVDALLSIVQNHTLRATDIRYLNDAAEFKLFLQESLLQAETARQGTALPDRCEPNEVLHNIDYLRFFRSNFWGSVTDLVESLDYLGVVCFSQAENDLSQWRAYTPLGLGVCIEFDREKLNEHAKSLDCALFECNYSSQDLVLESGAWIKRADDIFDWEYPHVAAKLYFKCLTQIGASFKHSSFSKEREVRLVTPPFNSIHSEQILNLNCHPHQISFRSGRYSAIPYVDLRCTTNATGSQLDPATTIARLPITSITVGPTREPDLAVRAIKNVVWRYLGPVEKDFVKYCDVPFRSI